MNRLLMPTSIAHTFVAAAREAVNAHSESAVCAGQACMRASTRLRNGSSCNTDSGRNS